MTTENKVLSYFEICQNEGSSLQRGMNFQLHGKHSVILMSLRPNSPYQDAIEEGGAVLIYEGHNCPRTAATLFPKLLDQPEFLPGGGLTQNGKFHQAVKEYKSQEKDPELVRVYEKIRKGIWTDNGFFRLVDSWQQSDGTRLVFKYRLEIIQDIDSENGLTNKTFEITKHRRMIPTHVKLDVWKRDAGKCTKCGASDELHFDHVLPYSLGGTSLKAENVQLLCARHNLQKSDNIE